MNNPINAAAINTYPLDLLPLTPQIPSDLARHAGPDLTVLPALFAPRPDYREWECVAYLLESPLMYERVKQTWGPGLHERIGDWDELQQACTTRRERAMVRTARMLLGRENVLVDIAMHLESEDIRDLVEAIRIRGWGGPR